MHRSKSQQMFINPDPIDIENVAPSKVRITNKIIPGYTTVIQQRGPYVDVLTERTKNELISYLMDMRDSIENDKKDFSLLAINPTTATEFDRLLVKVQREVASNLNRLSTAQEQKDYIDRYIIIVRHESFLARGKKKTNKKKSKKTKGKKRRMTMTKKHNKR